MPGNFQMDMKYYLDASGNVAEAVNNGDGWEFPEAPVDDDGRHVTEIADDDPRIAEYLRGKYGFDPRSSSQDFRYAPGGGNNVEINNAGTWEQGALTQSGDRLPVSQAQASGESYSQLVNQDESGGLLGQLGDLAKVIGPFVALASGSAALMNSLGAGGAGMTADLAGGAAADDAFLGEYWQSIGAGAPEASTVAGTLSEGVGGVTTDPGQTLFEVTDATNPTSTLSEVVEAAPSPDLAGGAAADDAFLGQHWTDIGAGAPSGSSGLINSLLDNKLLVAAGMQAAGGVGAALLNSANMDKKIEADKALQDQKVDNAIELEQAKRALIQGGSYFDAKLPFKAKPGVVTRPDGTPVYDNRGLISRAMGA